MTKDYSHNTFCVLSQPIHKFARLSDSFCIQSVADNHDSFVDLHDLPDGIPLLIQHKYSTNSVQIQHDWFKSHIAPTCIA